MLRCTFAPLGLLLLLVISSLLLSSSRPIAEVPTLEAKAVDSGNSSTVPIRQTQTRSIEYIAMNAVRQQRSTDVTYTVNEIVLEYRKFVNPETGAQLQYAVYRPVQKQKTTSIDYFLTIMVPEKKQATIEYPTPGM